MCYDLGLTTRMPRLVCAQVSRSLLLQHPAPNTLQDLGWLTLKILPQRGSSAAAEPLVFMLTLPPQCLKLTSQCRAMCLQRMAPWLLWLQFIPTTRALCRQQMPTRCTRRTRRAGSTLSLSRPRPPLRAPSRLATRCPSTGLSWRLQPRMASWRRPQRKSSWMPPPGGTSQVRSSLVSLNTWALRATACEDSSMCWTALKSHLRGM